MKVYASFYPNFKYCIFFFFFDILLISLPFLLQFVNIFLTIVETIHQKILQLQASFI